jgi:hypothetical protein
MLIRKPVAEVFEAFVNPGITREILFHQKQRKPLGGSTLFIDFQGSDQAACALTVT